MANVTSGSYQKYYQEMYKTNNHPPHVKRMGRTGLEGYITGRPFEEAPQGWFRLRHLPLSARSGGGLAALVMASLFSGRRQQPAWGPVPEAKALRGLSTGTAGISKSKNAPPRPFSAVAAHFCLWQKAALKTAWRAKSGRIRRNTRYPRRAGARPFLLHLLVYRRIGGKVKADVRRYSFRPWAALMIW